MKALSPVRGCYEAVCCLSERSLAIARGRGKSPAAEEPLSLLDDMNHCYSRLRELVPGVPRGTQLSQVEILQRVIDYILDLQVVLAEPAPGPPDGPHLPIQLRSDRGGLDAPPPRFLPRQFCPNRAAALARTPFLPSFILFRQLAFLERLRRAPHEASPTFRVQAPGPTGVLREDSALRPISLPTPPDSSISDVRFHSEFSI
ncbi:hypothetical protein E5288_WYG016939 [Bos mutus]|uniref:DNA-binding protein inhibitor ID-3 n=1 Tax=Bos mutus TaxID=72004 RepID=A0A6B0RUK0_9CETA|nr:hypothetical protein [Bos mutus]